MNGTLRNATLLPAVACLMSCRGPQEETLARFFSAVQSGDSTTIAGMSTVSFPEAVESWDVLEIRPETTEPFQLPDLRRQVSEAEAERDRQFAEYSAFRNENLQDLKAIQERLDRDPSYRFQGKWGEVRAEWEKFRERYEDLDRRRQEILRRIDLELKLAKMSLMSSEEVGQFEGEIAVTDVVLKVSTRGAGERDYLFVLAKYNLKSRHSDYRPPSRWIVRDIRSCGESSSPC